MENEKVKRVVMVVYVESEEWRRWFSGMLKSRGKTFSGWLREEGERLMEEYYGGGEEEEEKK